MGMSFELDIVMALKRSPVLGILGNRALLELAKGAEPQFARDPGVTLYEEGAFDDGIYVLLEGEVELSSAGNRLSALSPGMAFGEEDALEQKPRMSCAKISKGGTRVYRIPLAHVEATAKALRTVGRALQKWLATPLIPSSLPSKSTQQWPVPAHMPSLTGAEILTFTADAEVGAPVGDLLELVAQVLAVEFGDRVLVATPAEYTGASEPAPKVGADLVDRQAIGASAWKSILAAHSKAYDYIFLDLSRRPSDEELAAPATTRVHFTRRDSVTPAKRAIRVHVREAPPRVSPGSFREMVALASAFGPKATEEVRIESPKDMQRVDECVIALDMRSLTRLPRSGAGRLSLEALRSAGDLGAAVREHAAAIARCISHRQLGVALGGGGALGFAHVVLLRAIRGAGLPIDMVSGSSFGAVVGAYYCASPREGLDMLLTGLDGLQMAVNLGPLSSAFVGAYISAALGCPYIEDLPVRYFPVATNICTGTLDVIKSGPVGFAVRASGAFPGIFTPATLPNKRYVDGGIADSVPACVLSAHGADLVVASNVIPLPRPIDAGRPLLPGHVGRMLFEFNPLHRLRDVVRAPFVVFHNAGNAMSSMASVHFMTKPNLSEYVLWDLHLANTIMEAAEKELSEQRIIAKIQKAWKKLRVPEAAT
jgi:predicted acylesterase/phospholipase RssA